MPAVFGHNETAPAAVGEACAYTSRMIRAYQSWLSKQSGTRLLDCGPVCDDSINFFLPQVQIIYICDLFLRMHRHRDTAILIRELDYAPGSFDAIHLWDLIDHLDTDTAPDIIDACCSLLKPGGSMLITAYEQFRSPDLINAFAVSDNCRVVLRPQHHLVLPHSYWANRDIIHLMNRFNLNTSFMYQCGVREFYFRRK